MKNLGLNYCFSPLVLGRLLLEVSLPGWRREARGQGDREGGEAGERQGEAGREGGREGRGPR